MKTKTIKHRLDALLALLLTGIFAVCLLAILLTGVRVYGRLTQRDQAAYEQRTCIQYLASRVRQADTAGGVGLLPFGRTQALVLGLEQEYQTRVYYYDGYIMELYMDVQTSDGFAPQDGERILPAAALDFELEDGLLSIIVTDLQGGQDTLLLSLRSDMEAVT